jgi:hypothetical protein
MTNDHLRLQARFAPTGRSLGELVSIREMRPIRAIDGDSTTAERSAIFNQFNHRDWRLLTADPWSSEMSSV